MAKCKYCFEEMEEVVGCAWNQAVEFPDGKLIPSVPYAHDEYENCHDCNAKRGYMHHPGCDMERCPRCGGQLIGCGCLDAEEE